MPLVTGTPEGTIIEQDDIYVEGAPYIYYQSSSGVDELHHPDSDGFYWGLSGTVANPVYALGCYEGVTFSDNVEVNAVRCDNVGDISVLQKRGHLELKFTLKSLFPLSTIRALLKGGAVTVSGDFEKMGIGPIDNAEQFYVYFPKVYDEAAADYVSITGHKCKFVDAWEMTFPYGNPWTLSVTIWMLADTTMPSAQQFATIIRYDPDAIP